MVVLGCLLCCSNQGRQTSEGFCDLQELVLGEKEMTIIEDICEVQQQQETTAMKLQEARTVYSLMMSSTLRLQRIGKATNLLS